MPTHNVSKKRGKSKIKISDKREAVMRRMGDSYSEDFDVKITVIQELIPLGLKAVADELQEEVKKLAGEKHSRGGSASSNNARWGRQQGSVYLRDQKFPISVPRVRDVAANREVPLETYRGLQRPFDDDEGAMCRLLHGLSTHKYHESAALAAEAFGISASSLSKRFKRGSADKLRQLQTRSLAREDIAAGRPLPAGLIQEQVLKRVYLVENGQHAYGGYTVFRRICWQMPMMLPLFQVIFFPGMGIVGPVMYAFVARNRMCIGGGKGKSCRVPAG